MRASVGRPKTRQGILALPGECADFLRAVLERRERFISAAKTTCP